MRIFLDTEFDNSQFISIALVDESGDSYYGIMKTGRIYNEWVRDNVIPVLGDIKPQKWGEIVSDVRDFINRYDHPTIICDWAADIQHLVNMFHHADYMKCI